MNKNADAILGSIFKGETSFLMFNNIDLCVFYWETFVHILCLYFIAPLIFFMLICENFVRIAPLLSRTLYTFSFLWSGILCMVTFASWMLKILTRSQICEYFVSCFKISSPSRIIKNIFSSSVFIVLFLYWNLIFNLNFIFTDVWFKVPYVLFSEWVTNCCNVIRVFVPVFLLRFFGTSCLYALLSDILRGLCEPWKNEWGGFLWKKQKKICSGTEW